MKDPKFAVLTCLLLAAICAPANAEGFKFPKITNPFKKPTAPTEPPRVTGSNLNDQPTAREPSSFSFPKPKLPKLELPSFGWDRSDTASSGTMSRSSTSRQASSRTTSSQSRANHNHPAEPSALDKFSQGTKSFFSKAKTTLMPWTADDEASQPGIPPSGSGARHSSRSNSGMRTASRSNSSASSGSANKGFTFPWSKPKPEVDDEIRSPTDFLSLDRPKY